MRRLVPCLALAACMPLLGCAGATQNVRAYRAYAYESPSLLVSIDRVEDLQKTLELVDKILVKTPYTPGDAWVDKLPLLHAEASTIRAEIKAQEPYSGGDFEVPVLKIYRIHLERVLADVPDKGDYPSLLDAVGSLSADSADLKTHWGTFLDKQKSAEDANDAFEKVKAKLPAMLFDISAGDTPELKAARQVKDDAQKELDTAAATLRKDIDAIKQKPISGEKGAQTLKGATAAVSVAYRVELEALAMMPIIVVQTVRSLPKLAKGAKDAADAPKTAIKGVGQLSELPGYVGAVKETMTRQSAVLDLMTEALAGAAKSTVEQTPGFALKDSVVDTVVGVTLDSLRVRVKAGGEAFFFSQAGSKTSTGQDASSSSSDTGTGDSTQSSGKTTYDFDHDIKGGPGRQTKLKYDVKPILLASASLNIAFDAIKLPDAANFNIGYKTDRMFSSGGKIENGSLAKQLGVNGVASDALDLGLGVLGVQTSVRLATFTAGTVTLVQPNDVPYADPITGKDIAAPFQINYTQIDVGYDLAFLMGESAGKYYLEQFIVGARYFRYVLPRVLYEMEDTTAPGSNSKDHNYVFVRESPVQKVPSRYYMGGFTTRFGGGTAPVVSMFADLGIYAGGGPTAYFFLKDPGQSTLSAFTKADEDVQHKTAIAFNLVAALGVRLRLIHPAQRLRISGELQYRAELLYASTSADSGPDGHARSVEFGGADIFHGPRLNLLGEF